MAAPSEFPEIQGGGSLMLAWQIRGKKALIVGGGEVAAGRIYHLLNADAAVTCVSPSAGLHPEVAHRIAHGQVTHVDRVFVPTDLDDPAISMVLVAIDDPVASSEIWKLCKARRIPANIADVPPECDFYFGSIHRDGPLQIMVSTNGKGPRLANQIRRHIAESLPPNAGAAVEKVGALRARLRQIAPDAEEGPKRMRWMIMVSDALTFEQLCALTDEDMENILGYYMAEGVPTFKEIMDMRAEKKDIDPSAEEEVEDVVEGIDKKLHT
ncbi:hypothetical protein MCOR34_004245 [Pyricularia oryzae]|nr:hypothetical protein MCOR34_004245 [Pyricularia oryzae]KAI6603537.1 hypothetical protein MCOR04_001700 [Pyricularia oryzae]